MFTMCSDGYGIQILIKQIEFVNFLRFGGMDL